MSALEGIHYMLPTPFDENEGLDLAECGVQAYGEELHPGHG